jgi:Lar family restriction alleviation protein
MSEPIHLKSCPFCGGNAHIHFRASGAARGSGGHQVYCGECLNGTCTRYETPAYAAAAWNRRQALAQESGNQ